MPSDIEIASSVALKPIQEIGAQVGLAEDDLEIYGKHMAKVGMHRLVGRDGPKRGKLVLVTAMTPTPAGEGKTTVSIGLSQALNRIGRKSLVAIREPSLGPVFGMKGGAAGGGWSQVVPMEQINLHFTGDLHAVTAAHNLLIAMLDNHIHRGNRLGIEWRNSAMKRCMDVCDRSLRHTVVGLGGKTSGVPRGDGFEITAASEVMTLLGLSDDLADLKARLGRLIAAYARDESPVTAADLGAVGAMAALLRDAMKPNLVQTLEGTPALIHTGPFGNVAHGCSSVIATRLGLSLCDYVVTEAGFGSDLGAEKFFNIKCRAARLKPNAAVVTATIRALKYQGGVELRDLERENVHAVEIGLANLAKHVENVQLHGVSPVVAINRFQTDTAAELQAVHDYCASLGVRSVEADVWGHGGEGGEELAQAVCEACEQPNGFHFLYVDDMPVADKIETIAKRIYGAADVQFLSDALKMLDAIQKLDFNHLPVCIAKTQNSLSADKTRRGRPKDFTVEIRDLKICAGAGFIVAYAGDILTMFGLPPTPAAVDIDVDEQGRISGLF